MRTPATASLRSSPCSTSAVAIASGSARWHGIVAVPKKPASVLSLRSGTSAAPRTSRASSTVSSTGKAGQGTPEVPQAALRKPTSKGALCAVSTQPRANARNIGRTALIGGAWPTIASVMPVSAVMSAGIALPGLTSVQKCDRICPPLTRTAPISVIPASSGSQPVVSTSTMTKSSSASGWGSSASSRGRSVSCWCGCPAGSGGRACAAGTGLVMWSAVTRFTVKRPTDSPAQARRPHGSGPVMDS